MTTPLVIGGAGFIGSSLVRELAAQGPVRVFDDMSTGRHDNIANVGGVDFVDGSILDEAALARALTDVSVVYHLACLGVRHSIQHPLANHAVNAFGTLKVLEEARRQRRSRVVYVSTSEVYGSAQRVPMTESHPTWPHTVYGSAKLAGEAYTRAYHRTYGLETVVIRPFNAYGPRSHHEGDSGEVIPKFVIRAMNRLPALVFGDGHQTRDFTFVSDTARAIAKAGTAPEAVGETINVGSGSETSILELATFVAKATGRTDLEPEFNPPRPGDVLRLHADSSKARRVLSWQPEVSLTEGLGLLLAWHAEQRTNWAAALAEDVAHNWTAAEPTGGES
jgi:UDP-glucose 4-epimerase